MPAERLRRRKLSRTATIDVLTDERRRRILAVLLDGPGTVAVEELAASLTGAQDPPDAESDRAVDVALEHVHLPKLDDAGLVSRDESAGTVTLTDAPVLDDPEFRRIVEGDAPDAVIDCLVRDRRRFALAVLRERDVAVPLDDLASAVAVREGANDAGDDVAASLHHVHLPKLDDAGLVEYDAEAKTAAPVGHPELPLDPSVTAPVTSPPRTICTE